MDYKQEKSQLDLRLFRIWMKANKAVFENIRKDIESYSISPENFMVLELLYNKGAHPIQKISETLSIPSGSITYVVNKLEKQGLVERKPNPNDKRAFNVTLTENGEVLFSEMFAQHVTTISENFSFVSNEEKEQLVGLLKKIGIGAQSLQK
ncbi:MarR family transcriptional regulator (plasmid) [Priestia megaterium]|uniref:Winged helix DNA-binding domain protein n=1 Tax=Priestia megaterium (strain ATCC 14581 / DSM 32 / CCUG 1817 / JCM 2506 / NBRC 15308 / NCIMB 9376 / NCTC 10342 / NRRL B-14308 / VKM B-512 / Ford 19) TaxID=1348623 RepID=A0A0B6B0A5_PRIM2|nr:MULTISPECIES: MarR family transcriptional regulator [Priestia]AJI25614.1 winged helix DNA-binding domain protein [Priestia megaterium NBRC 15308 = ATCC 14581]AJI25666.1 winged helix DNA-binding domain protein [Priestia megaterium NBRC 15308 = ATCC 14581]KFN08597.1 marR family protein [Priestia megaterium]KGJ80457.1 transcriptional regulator [Priestia megaterium NBRC 15308 = ATCC 14581]KGJ82311.1 transcriptional regulator [Priestia megaterium NBRC 15308 = ATCC 14581]